jgi:predicted MPP superfamily phosphohydrolase
MEIGCATRHIDIPSMSPIRIVHLSDLHASEAGAAAKRVAAAAIEDIKRADAEAGVDLVAFTGDLARTGKRAEYELANDWLVDPLLDALNLDESHLALVPGNHDVLRSSVNRYSEEGLRAALTDAPGVARLMGEVPALGEATQRLAHWNEYYLWLTEEVDETSAAGLGWTRTLEIDGLDVGIASLNTAWRSFDDADRGYLLLGDAQVDAALENIAGCGLRLVLMHHPFPWLATFDADRARRRIEGARTLVLSGHDHKPDPTAEFSLRGGAIYSRAGCLYESPEKLNGYTIIDVDVDRGVVDFRLRTWFPERGEFDQAIQLPGAGETQMAWVELPRLPAKPNYSVVLETLGRQASELSVLGAREIELEAPVPDDLLVEPRLWPAPYREIAAARDLDGSQEPAPADPLETMGSSKVLLVVGEPESGVSGALLWTLAAHFEERGTHTPFSTPYERQNFKPTTFVRQIRQNAIATGQHLGDKEDVPPSIIGIDDVAEGKALPGLAEFIALRDEHIFVLGCHEDAEDAVVKALGERGVEFSKLYLGPLGRAQVRALIEKAGGLTDGDVDRIYGLVINQHLPRTPFIIAALIVAIEQHQDPANFNESALLDACAAVLLGTEEFAPGGGAPLEPIHREKLLAEFAAEMTRRGIDRLAALESEELFGDYFRERGWGQAVTPGDVLANLVERKILRRDEEGVGFRHNALLDLFAGKQLDIDSGFLAEVLEDPFKHPDPIRHAAGLRRDDLGLLDSIETKSSELFEEAGAEIDVTLFDRIKDKKGWSDQDPDLDDIKELLADRPPPPDEDERDRKIDQFADDVEYSDKVDGDEEELSLVATLEPAANLLSGVLRNSELVPDVDLKVKALKDAIHGWSLIAIVMAVEEDQSNEVLERVKDGSVADLLDADEESAARVAEMMITMIMGVVVTGALASRKLEEVAGKALDDEGFYAVTAHALFGTIFYVLMAFDGWDRRLLKLSQRHGEHPIVKGLVLSLATSFYRSADTGEQEAGRLLEYLTDQVSRKELQGLTGATAARARSGVMQDLQKTRQKALMASELGISREKGA